MATANATLSAVGSCTITLGSRDNRATFSISGTYSGVSLVFEGVTSVSGTDWQQLAALRLIDATWETSTSSPTNNSTRAWAVDTTGFAKVRLRVTAISSGTLNVLGSSLVTTAPPLIPAAATSMATLTAGTITTLTTSSDILNTSGVGAAAGTGVTASERGSGAVHKTVLTLVNTPVVLADEAGVVAYGGLKIYDFPAGAILILGAVADLDLTKSSAGVNADFDGDFALGTVTASNNNTLSSTEANVVPSTPTPQAAAGVTTANGQSTVTQMGVLDGTATAIDLFLNALVDDADHDVTGTPCNLLFNGTITLMWSNLGDY